MQLLFHKAQGSISVLETPVGDDLQQWMEIYIQSCKARNLSAGTVGFYVQKLGVYSKYCQDLAITKINQITPNNIREFLIFLEVRKHNPAGIHCYYRALKAFLRWFEQETEPEGWQNPINKVKPPKVPVVPLTPASVETIKALLDSCNNNTFLSIRDKTILICLFDTGARLGEFLALNSTDIDLMTGKVQILSGKGRKYRFVFLGEKARILMKKYLKRRSDQNPSLWVGRSGERLTDTGLRQILRRRSKRAGVLPPSPHGFRRAFALIMLRNGVDIFTLQKLMGHSDLQTLRRYLAQTDEDLKLASIKYSPVDTLV